MRQGQSLVMTQQLQQSIKLLQLSSQELAEFVEQELEKNPLLAAEENEAPAEKSNEDPVFEDETPAVAGAGEEVAAEEPAPTDADAAAKSEDDWANGSEEGGYEDSYGESAFDSRTRGAAASAEEGEGFESFTAQKVSLREHLLDQLRVTADDPVIRILGQHLIDLVDESGYIKEDTGGIAELLGCDAEHMEAAFTLLHSFDPIGVCARSLAECLAIQLRDKDRLDPAMQVLLQHLDLVARNDMDALRKLCGVDVDDVRDMCAEIRALNPRPGSGFEHEAVQAIEPDVFLRRRPDSGWQVELNSHVLPRVLVNRRYYAQLSQMTRDKPEKKYLSDHLLAANWLVKALDQRAHTILKVSTEIVTQQDGFFRHGIKYLRPLTLKEVAAAVGLHESTVSRVTTNKYMATPRGTYELKYFFNASIQNSSGGEGYSNKTVQYIIKELIDAEAPNAILSDDAIAEELKSRGIDIARRTVAKYREGMQISSSSVRRREKSLKA
jgi:RNA polymerase sigma-54 factor